MKTKYNTPEARAIYKRAQVARTHSVTGKVQCERKTGGALFKEFQKAMAEHKSKKDPS